MDARGKLIMMALVCLTAHAVACGVDAATITEEPSPVTDGTAAHSTANAETQTVSAEPTPADAGRAGYQAGPDHPITRKSVVARAYVAPASPVPSDTQSTSTPETYDGGIELSNGLEFVDSMFGPISCDQQEDVMLTHHVYPPDQFDILTPMGRMWSSHVTPTDHLYLGLRSDRDRGMVTSPADGEVIQIQRFPNDQWPHWNPAALEPDYRLIVAHSCTLFSIFIHLGELAPEIEVVTGGIAPGQNWYPDRQTKIALKAGDPIARFGGSTIDYSLHDANVILMGFQVPEHYEGEAWKIHTVDPLDYWPEGIVEALMDKSERVVEPLGGKIDYDIPGRLVGNWFLDGTVDYRGTGSTSGVNYWEGHLAIAYDHIDPSQIRISIGRGVGLTHDDCRSCGGVYAIRGNGPDPATITAMSGLVKYELTGRHHAGESTEITISDDRLLGTLIAQVLDETSIRIEFFKGEPANSVTGFGSASLVYRR